MAKQRKYKLAFYLMLKVDRSPKFKRKGKKGEVKKCGVEKRNFGSSLNIVIKSPGKFL